MLEKFQHLGVAAQFWQYIGLPSCPAATTRAWVSLSFFLGRCNELLVPWSKSPDVTRPFACEVGLDNEHIFILRQKLNPLCVGAAVLRHPFKHQDGSFVME